MAFLETVSDTEFSEALASLADDCLPLTMTVRYGTRWVTFRTRSIAQSDQVVWVQCPDSSHLREPYKFKVGEQIGITFNLGHRKYVFAAKVVRLETYSIDDGTKGTSLKLLCSGEKHRVERRLHPRNDLASKRTARARFWLGGRQAKPADNSQIAPIWTGSILNISHGGILIRATLDAVKCVEIGDVVGIQITFGGEEAAIIDGQLRHCAADGEMALIGVQFVEGSQTDQTIANLDRIRQRMASLTGESPDGQAESHTETPPGAAGACGGQEDEPLAVH